MTGDAAAVGRSRQSWKASYRSRDMEPVRTSSVAGLWGSVSAVMVVAAVLKLPGVGRVFYTDGQGKNVFFYLFFTCILAPEIQVLKWRKILVFTKVEYKEKKLKKKP